LLAESPGLYEKLSAKEFLEFMGALYDVPGDILPKRIVDLLKLFGLHDRRDYLLEGYSRGMKQKILIASALIHDPPILFLDEPTSMLDPRAALMVKDLIKGLAEKAGKTIFISSHILPVVEELCDRIGIINQGRLIALGKVDEIIAETGTKTLEEAFINKDSGRSVHCNNRGSGGEGALGVEGAEGCRCLSGLWLRGMSIVFTPAV